MILVTKIKMRPGYWASRDLTEIDSVYLTGVKEPGFYHKEAVHDYLMEYPGDIQVGLWPYPDVIPATSIRGEKYVKSEPNQFGYDNLLSLPKE